ncbi:threonine transporter [Alteromonas stellipolaris]|uniref:ABC-three component system middle component 2 n=1 Tax=Alteromonas stellipolaris TaxID=233316 RepID=UPI0026E42A4A|nr:ABC-three component system middle component 2 [Alteromonas stellipolaris]MDO6537962.1 threonine transporter [Alteromonas stellipolaris]
MMSETLHSDFIFNSALETGVRSICILVADLSNKFDIQQLLALDHIVVHTGDIENAPPSLHPNILQRSGELLVRRPLIENGLVLMESKRLVQKVITPDGFYYCATELASVFIESLTNEYIKELSQRAQWAVTMYNDYGDMLFSEIFNSAFDRWRNEFQIAEMSIAKK